ncbi:hypothetical protein [Bacillus pumilus]|nr:hypothetical protein [Bacillus pumilus]
MYKIKLDQVIYSWMKVKKDHSNDSGEGQMYCKQIRRDRAG